MPQSNVGRLHQQGGVEPTSTQLQQTRTDKRFCRFAQQRFVEEELALNEIQVGSVLHTDGRIHDVGSGESTSESRDQKECTSMRTL